MKYFYKIEDYRAHIGSGEVMPEDFIEYTVGSEPQELIDGLAFKTPEEVLSDKWDELSLYLSTLTVQRVENPPTPLGFKFSADPESLSNISLEIDTMLDTDTRMWYESWGNQEVTKQELQEAKRLASEAKQVKLIELFGA